MLNEKLLHGVWSGWCWQPLGSRHGARELRLCSVEHGLVGGILPQHQVSDDVEQPLALGTLRLPGGELFRHSGRVVDQLAKQHGAASSPWPSGPPEGKVEGWP